jgi:TIR domain
VASAFVSYAHEDREFVLALVERLQAQGLEIRYDGVVLEVGDSLIQVISREISEGDFLIAVVSPASVNSEWCQKELAIAATDGVEQRRVKVLPVRFQGAPMPPLLRDTYWADADVDDPETLARRLASAMRAHLEGRGADAARDAEQAQEAGGEPAHAERLGDVGVAQIEEISQRALDVLAVWARVWDGGNLGEVTDAQRRLRWALDALPDQVRGALPLVGQLANAAWEEFYEGNEPDDVEPDLREEMRSVRTQVAQGLPVTRRWAIVADTGERVPVRRDAVSYLWPIRRAEEQRLIQVYISRTALMSEDEHLPREVVEAKQTNGRSSVTTLLGLDDPPEEVMVTTAGISLTLPD